MPKIHPTALVDSTADLAADVEVGPFAIVEGGVQAGAGCRVEAHAHVLRGTRMGERNIVGRASIIGGDPQSTGFDARAKSRVRIGSNNVVGERVTVHRSAVEGGETVVGSGNFLLKGSHAGHDTRIEDGNVLSTGVLLGGHVSVGSRCFLGSGSACHQFVRLGDFVEVRHNSSISKDVPPFAICTGLNRICGINLEEMDRAGLSDGVRHAVCDAFIAVLRGSKSSMETAQVMLDAAGFGDGGEVRLFLEFMLAPSRKGVSRWNGSEGRGESEREE